MLESQIQIITHCFTMTTVSHNTPYNWVLFIVTFIEKLCTFIEIDVKEVEDVYYKNQKYISTKLSQNKLKKILWNVV